MSRARFLWLLCGVAALVFLVTGAIVVLTQPRPAAQSASRPAASAGLPGGSFQMTDQDGRPVTEAALKGKPTVMFFGFTYCPDVCPTTLAEVTAWLKALGPRADRLNVVFVSVDPERDTPAQLKSYLSAFDPRIRGLTGTPEALAAMAKAYKAYYQKVPLEGGGYTMDHSSTLFLFDADGVFVGLIPYGAGQAEALPKLQALTR